MTYINRLVLSASFAGLLASCSTGVDMPHGNGKGYQSARLVQPDPNRPAITNETEKQVHGMIQKSIARQFTSKGMAYGGNKADLVVAYLVLVQEPGSTSRYDRYFGYSPDTDKISELAHTRGVLDSNRPDYFREAGIVFDVIDTKTNKLVYRNFVRGDVVKGASGATRAARIEAAVAQALGGFFR